MEAVPLSHILFTGRFEALEAEFLRRLELLQEGDALRGVDVLAGSNLLAVYLRRLAADRRGAIANVRFLTFVDLARQVVPGPDPRPELPELGAALLARRALLETPEAAQFGPLRERPSLAAALVRSADDLRDAQVPASVLRSPTSLAAAPDRRAFLDAVGASIERLESFRSAFSDATSLLERAAGGALTPHPAPLLVYGLYDLGGVREALLSRVARSRPVIAFVPEGADPGFPRPARASGPPVRGDLFRRLLGVPPTPLAAGPGDPEVLTVLAPTENVEAREVVRELLRGVADGIPLHRMAVIVRDPPRQEPAIAAELRLRNLPFFRPPGPGNSRSPEGVAIRALVALAANDVPCAVLEELFSLLEGLGTPAVAYRPARLVTALGLLRFTRGREALQRKLAAARGRLSAPAHASDDPEGRAVRRRRREAEALEGLSTAVDAVLAALPEASDAPWSTWAERLVRAADLLLEGAPGRKSLDAAFDAISSLSAVETGLKTIADVVALLPDALDTEPVREGRFERDGIALLSAVSARGLRFDLVVVPGLVEQTFPKRGLPDPLLFDSERAAIADKTRCSLAPRSGLRHAREERFLFEITAASARTRLVLLATERDASADRPRVLSPYLLDHLAIDTTASTASTASPSSTSRNAVSEKELRQRALEGKGVRRVLLGRVEPAGPALDGSEALLRALQASPGLGTRLVSEEALARALSRRAARLNGTFTAHEGRLGRPSPASFVRRVVSASRLEQLATCAYRVFFAHVLRLAPRDEMRAGLPVLDPMTRGSLAHEALRDLVRDLIAHGRSFGDLTEADARSRARQLSEAASRSWGDAVGEEVAPVFVSLAARDLETVLNAVLDFERARQDGPPVAGAEIRFGPAPGGADTERDDALSSPEPVEYASEGATWRLSGQIDRLDRSAIDDALRVIDYKFARPRPYSRKRPDLLVAGGERLQLPIYALAARRLGGEEVSSEYLFVGRDNRTGRIRVDPVSFTPEQTREAVASLGRFLDLAGRVFEAGDFVPRTRSSFDGEDSCRYCDFRTICGPGHAAVFERKRAAEPATSPTRLFEELR